MTIEKQESKLQRALWLIKFNMVGSTQNIPLNGHDRDLHEAVQLIVDVAREYGLCQK